MVSTFDTINSKIKTRKLIPSYFRNSKVVNTFLKKNIAPFSGFGFIPKLILHSLSALWI